MPSQTNDQKSASLAQAFERLPDQARRLLQLLALFQQPVSRTVLAQGFALAGERVGGKGALTPAFIAPLVEKLARARLLTESGGRIACRPELAEAAARRSLTDGSFDEFAKAVESHAGQRRSWYGSRYYGSADEAQRDLRLALYRGESEAVREILENVSQLRFPEFVHEHPLRRLVENNFAEGWLRAMPEAQCGDVLAALLADTLMRTRAPGAVEAFAERLCREGAPQCSGNVVFYLVTLHLLCGRWESAATLLPADAQGGGYGDLVRGWCATFGDDPVAAVGHFEDYLAGEKARGNRRKAVLPWDYEPAYLFALLRSGQGEPATRYVRQQCSSRNAAGSIECLLQRHLLELAGEAPGMGELLVPPPGSLKGAYSLLYFQLLYWEDTAKARHHAPLLEKHRCALENAGYRWLAAEVAELLARLGGPGAGELAASAATARAQAGASWSGIELVARVEPWQRTLTALAHLAERGVGGGAEPDERLVWLVGDRHGWAVQPKVQKRSAKGNWSSGRNVALRRLHEENATLPFVTAADRKVIAAIRRESHGWGYAADHYDLDAADALQALMDHPLVFLDGEVPVRVEVVRGQPELRVEHEAGQLRITLVPDPDDQEEPGVAILREGLNRIRVVPFDARQREIAAVLDGGLVVPESARDQVLASLGAIAGLVTVHSDIGGGGEVHETLAGDPTPHLQLLPFEAGLKAMLSVRPFGGRGPYVLPGAGGRTLVVDLEGQRVQADRSLDLELTRAAEIEAACPALAAAEPEEGARLLPEPEQALELLEQLHGLGERVQVEWPQGQRFRVTGQAGAGSLRLRVQSAREWFNATGEVRLADGQVWDMVRLLELLEQTPGRFLQVGEGEYIALTREFRRRLGELSAVAERSAKGLRLNPLAGLVLEELAAEAGEFVADREWQSFQARYEEAQRYSPTPPTTLQTDLRDYQLDGFRWLARLARWGVGACLADDMGLGKTVQALALLLHRAPEGPALVVAPTSVTGNWRAEASRFAPTLNVITYGGGEREALLANLKPFDLLVCTYGLLQQDTGTLAEVAWHTVVLDEAQAIKNLATKRAQAAMALRAEFRVITTGTPVENHLGELWTLFRFINPGLLGSLDRFNRRFAAPIERDRNAVAQANLRKLIQPFILRRTKTQVLDELPSRTEILQEVELGPDERAYYEALRARAITRLEAPAAESGSARGQRQFQILAEITRLRRACCNSRLVQDGPALPSAKLVAFGEILDELLENRHKALVFSQFVDHLALIRDYLDGRKVAYQYLDGGTPAAERDRRVRAFQAGEGDLFLISLKAGGVGLNLTAADYVIHMDPWWNPAVEDQAADRAHRIGQLRPVTIYRLVAKETIEEKIVALHHQKRALADSLLEGTEMGGKVSPEELLRLLREEA